MIDQLGLQRKPSGALHSDDTGAELISDINPAVDYSNAESSTRQFKGSVITGRAGTHHHHVIQFGCTSENFL